MPGRRNSRVFRLAFVLAMAFHMLLAPVDHAASHNPAALALAEVERHAVLAFHDAGHGHGHEDGRPDERRAGHSHGHNPADHTHDVPTPAVFPGQAGPMVGNAWADLGPRSHNHGPSFGIDRPPRT